MGVNHSVQGTETVALINTLCVLTGNVGRPGAAPFSITGQCNAMGTREAGFTASMPGYRPYDDPDARRELAALWGVDEDRLPAERGRAYPDIVNGVIDGRIKGLWIIATNPVVSFPNRELLEHALGRLDLLVVQDGFETPTTALADVVLPAAIWGEKDGTYTNSERRVSRVRAAVEPPGEARSDFDIVLGLAERLGVRDELFRGLDRARRRLRRVAAGVGRAAVRLQRHHLRAHRRRRRRAVAVPDGRPVGPARGDPAALRRPALPDPVGPGPAAVRDAQAHQRPAPAAVPAPAQHRPHRRALAHPDQDRARRDPRPAGPGGLGRGPPGRRPPLPGPRRRPRAARVRAGARWTASASG